MNSLRKIYNELLLNLDKRPIDYKNSVSSYYATLEDAVNLTNKLGSSQNANYNVFYIRNIKVIQLLNNITEDIPITLEDTILDLNGYTLNHTLPFLNVNSDYFSSWSIRLNSAMIYGLEDNSTFIFHRNILSGTSLESVSDNYLVGGSYFHTLQGDTVKEQTQGIMGTYLRMIYCNYNAVASKYPSAVCAVNYGVIDGYTYVKTSRNPSYRGAQLYDSKIYNCTIDVSTGPTNEYFNQTLTGINGPRNTIINSSVYCREDRPVFTYQKDETLTPTNYSNIRALNMSSSYISGSVIWTKRSVFSYVLAGTLYELDSSNNRTGNIRYGGSNIPASGHTNASTLKFRYNSVDPSQSEVVIGENSTTKETFGGLGSATIDSGISNMNMTKFRANYPDGLTFMCRLDKDDPSTEAPITVVAYSSDLYDNTYGYAMTIYYGQSIKAENRMGSYYCVKFSGSNILFNSAGAVGSVSFNNPDHSYAINDPSITDESTFISYCKSFITTYSSGYRCTISNTNYDFVPQYTSNPDIRIVHTCPFNNSYCSLTSSIVNSSEIYGWTKAQQSASDWFVQGSRLLSITSGHGGMYHSNNGIHFLKDTIVGYLKEVITDVKDVSGSVVLKAGDTGFTYVGAYGGSYSGYGLGATTFSDNVEGLCLKNTNMNLNSTDSIWICSINQRASGTDQGLNCRYFMSNCYTANSNIMRLDSSLAMGMPTMWYGEIRPQRIFFGHGNRCRSADITSLDSVIESVNGFGKSEANSVIYTANVPRSATKGKVYINGLPGTVTEHDSRFESFWDVETVDNIQQRTLKVKFLIDTNTYKIVNIKDIHGYDDNFCYWNINNDYDICLYLNKLNNNSYYIYWDDPDTSDRYYFKPTTWMSAMKSDLYSISDDVYRFELEDMTLEKMSQHPYIKSICEDSTIFGLRTRKPILSLVAYKDIYDNRTRDTDYENKSTILWYKDILLKYIQQHEILPDDSSLHEIIIKIIGFYDSDYEDDDFYKNGILTLVTENIFDPTYIKICTNALAHLIKSDTTQGSNSWGDRHIYEEHATLGYCANKLVNTLFRVC